MDMATVILPTIKLYENNNNDSFQIFSNKSYNLFFSLIVNQI